MGGVSTKPQRTNRSKSKSKVSSRSRSEVPAQDKDKLEKSKNSRDKSIKASSRSKDKSKSRHKAKSDIKGSNVRKSQQKPSNIMSSVGKPESKHLFTAYGFNEFEGQFNYAEYSAIPQINAYSKGVVDRDVDYADEKNVVKQSIFVTKDIMVEYNKFIIQLLTG